MDKRGISGHVDWILGVGLFLLAVGFIFVFFKPGVTPVYDSDTLLNVVQQGFEKDVAWSITKVPVFLSASKTDSDYPLPGKVYLDNKAINASNGESIDAPEGNYYDQLSSLIGGNVNEKKQYIKTFYVKTADEESPGAEIIEEIEDVVDEFCASNPDDEVCDDSDDGEGDDKKKPKKNNIKNAKKKLENKGKRDKQLKYEGKGKSLVLSTINFKGNVNVKKSKYIILVGSRPINFGTDNGEENINIVDKDKACFAVGKHDGSPLFGTLTEYYPNSQYSNLKFPQCPVVYEVGASEVLSGVDLASVLALQENLNIEELKESWGFPVNKDFKIEVESIPSGDFDKITIGNAEPPANVNVFVRSFNRFILTDDGINVPIVVRISLW